MARRNRECYLCGTNYKYCPTCTNDRTKPAWMAEFHSESCKNIFDICTRFNIGMVSKAEAQEELKSCDLTNRSNFKSYVQRDLDNIMAEEPKKRGKRAEMKILDEVMDVKPKIIEDITHEVVIKKEENE